MAGRLSGVADSRGRAGLGSIPRGVMKAVVAIARTEPELADTASQEGVAGARSFEAKRLCPAPPPGPPFLHLAPPPQR